MKAITFQPIDEKNLEERRHCIYESDIPDNYGYIIMTYQHHFFLVTKMKFPDESPSLLWTALQFTNMGIKTSEIVGNSKSKSRRNVMEYIQERASYFFSK